MELAGETANPPLVLRNNDDGSTRTPGFPNSESLPTPRPDRDRTAPYPGAGTGRTPGWRQKLPAHPQKKHP